jgi:hypothetical protein
MRLINTDTLLLEEFSDANIPDYVILSHTWGENEVSLEQFERNIRNNKLEKCCSLAKRDIIAETVITCYTSISKEKRGLFPAGLLYR